MITEPGKAGRKEQKPHPDLTRNCNAPVGNDEIPEADDVLVAKEK